MSALEAARAYLQRGWFVVPVPFRSKNPGLKGWQQLRLTAETVPHWFKGELQNIGILLGEPSGWLIDIDLDHSRAVELAAEWLPPTPAIFGRAGKLHSHWLYRVTAPVATKKIRSKSAGMIIELRSTGQHTIAPPSIYETGEAIEWILEGAEPAVVEPGALLDAVDRIGKQVQVELGERADKSAKSKSFKAAETAEPVALPNLEVSPDERLAQCLLAMQRIGMVDQHDSSARLFAIACRAVEYDLDDANALAAIREYARLQPFSRDWSDDDILRRVRDAEKRCARGSALKREADGTVGLGGRDPQSGKLVLSPRRTLPTAQAFIRDFHDHPDRQTLISYAGMLLHWSHNRYCELEDPAISKRSQHWLHDCLRYIRNRQTGAMELVPFDSNPATVNGALATIRNHVHLPAKTACPGWLTDSNAFPPPTEILPCRSCLLHLPTQQAIPSTPAFFTLNALEFDPVFDAPCPNHWLEFLHQLFDGDEQSFDLLQEWFGYCLTGDTSQQKMLLIVGPKRSGKGTLARVLAKLVGDGNVCGPTTSSLAGTFGLQPLIGKTLAIVSDARFSGENIATVVERLLCISGEDTLTIDRKFLSGVTMKLGTRFVFLSNELPRLNDSSGALAGRFLILRLTESFYGREDTNLTTKLLTELPGILNWAIEGWKELRKRGKFRMPQAGQDAMLDLEELSSPVSAFVREICEIGPGKRVLVDVLYDAWVGWCSRQGRTAIPPKQKFGRDLLAACPQIHCRRGSSQRFYDGIELKSGVI